MTAVDPQEGAAHIVGKESKRRLQHKLWWRKTTERDDYSIITARSERRVKLQRNVHLQLGHLTHPSSLPPSS
eukprot:CAMPEP_0201644104 /NCGR_PEP_ID=MMETSP0493-20130528/29550_1 /ASSEMBLY_ACC=CAM_ASM_000838 /TAXON_ID=420259 /ORGANISM="Thalassiosira gravida, Strain GMp14c1" /LENGTH=71 /DNA_ID=CAMNT_0048118727 /DNA_START=438 /DNA_END=650 /DNA_ORIENTATION=+